MPRPTLWKIDCHFSKHRLRERLSSEVFSYQDLDEGQWRFSYIHDVISERPTSLLALSA